MNCLKKIYKINQNRRTQNKIKLREKEHRGEIISCFGDNPNDPEKDYL